MACHGHGDEGIRDSVLAGVRSVEHGTWASAATLDPMRARGTYLVPTLSAVRDVAEPGGDYTDPADALVVGGDPLADLTALDDVRLIVAAGWIAHEGGAAAPSASLWKGMPRAIDLER